MLFETAAFSPRILMLVAAPLLGVALPATCFPVRRAVRVDLLVALRHK
jgi:ABC-type lipoprotein release transport system permease subunit